MDRGSQRSPFQFYLPELPEFLREMARRHGIHHVINLEARLENRPPIQLERAETVELDALLESVTTLYGEHVTVQYAEPACTRASVGWKECRCTKCIEIRREAAICTKLALEAE